MRATREARWLLGIDVANYLDKDLYLAASRFQALQSEFENVPAGEMRKPMAERKAEMRTWFLEQTTVLDKMFSPFLNLEH